MLGTVALTIFGGTLVLLAVCGAAFYVVRLVTFAPLDPRIDAPPGSPGLMQGGYGVAAASRYLQIARDETLPDEEQIGGEDELLLSEDVARAERLVQPLPKTTT